MSDALAHPPPGWYPDPADPGAQRWWDGIQWGQQRTPILLSTTNDLPGHRVDRVLGVCVGLVANSMGFGKSFSAGLQSMARGEVPQWTEALEAGRQAAMQRLEDHARQLGANAVLALRMDASELAGGLVEFVAYGTAAVVSPAVER
ncbi:MAG: heavy metal-binding domain-containing protein [Acidimicrobiales bacterium]|nr:heavy metal-binding domain-containing protein [Acidimicrobiales bacterium]